MTRDVFGPQDAELSAEQIDAIATATAVKVGGSRVTPATPADVAAARDAVLSGQSALASKSDITTLTSQLSTLGSKPGKVDLYYTQNGAAPSGVTKLSGLGVPSNLFSKQRLMLAGFGLTTWAGLVTAMSCVRGTGNRMHFISAGQHYEYNVGTDALVTRATHTLNNGSPVTSVSFGDDMYVIGQYSGSTVYQNSYKYSATSDSWSAIANLPAPRCYATLAKLSETKAWIIGGSTVTSYTASSMQSTVYEFNVTTGQFTAKYDAPARMINGKTATLSNNKFVVIAQVFSDGTAINSATPRCWLVDPSLPDGSQWTELDPPPFSYSTTDVLQVTPEDYVVHIPTSRQGTGARAKKLTTTAAPGSQWSDYEVPYQMIGSASYQTTFFSYGSYAQKFNNGLAPFSMSVFGSAYYALSLLYVGTTTPSWSELFYGMTN